MEPYPVGTVVEYHGSVEYKHGRYKIMDYGFDRLGVPISEYPEYTDGVCYHLWAEDVPVKFGNRDLADLHFVRRDSITPVEEDSE